MDCRSQTNSGIFAFLVNFYRLFLFDLARQYGRDPELLQSSCSCADLRAFRNWNKTTSYPFDTKILEYRGAGHCRCRPCGPVDSGLPVFIQARSTDSFRGQLGAC